MNASDNLSGRWYCVNVTAYDWDSELEEPVSLLHSDFARATFDVLPEGIARLGRAADYGFEARCSTGQAVLKFEEVSEGSFDLLSDARLVRGRLEFIARLIPDCRGGATDSFILVFGRKPPKLADPQDVVQIASTLEVDEVSRIIEEAEEKGCLTEWAQALWEAAIAGDFPTGKAVDDEEELFYAYLQTAFLDELSCDSYEISFDWLTHDHIRRGLVHFDPSQAIFSDSGRLSDVPKAFAELVKKLAPGPDDEALAAVMSPAWFPRFNPQWGPEKLFRRAIFPQPAFRDFWEGQGR